MAKARARKKPSPDVVTFEDNALLAALVGAHDRNLARIERQLSVTLNVRGNRMEILGGDADRQAAEAAVRDLYARLEKGLDVADAEVDAAVRMARDAPDDVVERASVSSEKAMIRTKRRRITPRSNNQAAYVRALREYDLIFGLGPAGTGKTYLAVAVAVSLMMEGKVDRMILARPAVEAGEKLGFLPGDMREKIDPYLRPLYDALYDMLPADEVVRRLENGEIEVAPLAFMRGRTLANAFVILDEAQNTTPVQMKMLLTRLGENSRMTVTGDPSQVDLPPGTRSGLQDALEVLAKVKGISFVRFNDSDVVRHPMVTRIVRAYAASEKEKVVTRNGKRHAG